MWKAIVSTQLQNNCFINGGWSHHFAGDGKLEAFLEALELSQYSAEIIARGLAASLRDQWPDLLKTIQRCEAIKRSESTNIYRGEIESSSVVGRFERRLAELNIQRGKAGAARLMNSTRQLERAE